MRITHKVDYGVRVMTVLAEVAVESPGRPISSAALAEREGLPPGFLDDILRLLRNGGLVRSQRGGDGGWQLARPAAEITVADVIRAVDGPLASVRGVRPHQLADAGERASLVALWVAVRASLRSVLEHVTLADLAAGTLPATVRALVDEPDSWDDPAAIADITHACPRVSARGPQRTMLIKTVGITLTFADGRR